MVPAPGGGGAVELAFRAALAPVIGPSLFAAALLWWRFYTFYIYIVLGAIVAGGTAIRAVRKTDEMEEELEARQHDAEGSDEARSSVAVTRRATLCFARLMPVPTRLVSLPPTTPAPRPGSTRCARTARPCAGC